VKKLKDEIKITRENNKIDTDISGANFLNGHQENISMLIEWTPAYFCEITAIKTQDFDSFFTFEVIDETFKKKGIFRKKFKKIEEFKEYFRYSINEIRNSTLLGDFRKYIMDLGFDCSIPTKHVRFGKNRDCLGKIITERIPRNLFNYDKNGAMLNEILIKEHQIGVLFNDGLIRHEFQAGKWDLSKYSNFSSKCDLFFIDKGNIQTRWGTSVYLVDGKSKLTATQVRLRVNGDLVIQISDPAYFLKSIVKDNSEFFEGNLHDIIKSKITELINQTISKADPLSVYQDVEDTQRDIKYKAEEYLNSIGLCLVSLSIANFVWDAEVEEIFKKRLEKIKVTGASEDANVDRELYRLKQLQQMGVDINSLVNQKSQENNISNTIPPSNFCSNCGNRITNEKFCPNCGNNIQKK